MLPPPAKRPRPDASAAPPSSTGHNYRVRAADTPLRAPPAPGLGAHHVNAEAVRLVLERHRQRQAASASGGGVLALSSSGAAEQGGGGRQRAPGAVSAAGHSGVDELEHVDERDRERGRSVSVSGRLDRRWADGGDDSEWARAEALAALRAASSTPAASSSSSSSTSASVLRRSRFGPEKDRRLVAAQMQAQALAGSGSVASSSSTSSSSSSSSSLSAAAPADAGAAADAAPLAPPLPLSRAEAREHERQLEGEREAAFERAFYLQDDESSSSASAQGEGGGLGGAGFGGDGEGGAGLGGDAGGVLAMEGCALSQRRAADIAQARARGEAKIKGASAKRSALAAAQEAWEADRLASSGVASRAGVDAARLAEEAEERVHLVVSNARPPFLLQAGASFAVAAAAVATVRDPTSDIAVAAKRGSPLLLRVRGERERQRMRKKFWELGGSKMGDIIGVAAPPAAAAAAEAEAAGAGGGAGGGAADEEAAASSFSQSRTLAEQRAFLPVTRVKDELLQVVRDNQVVVIVGETGSGKTTQLTQFLYEAGYTRGGQGGIIGCTQPRRVAAMSVAKRVAEEFGCRLGAEVGYSIRFEDCSSPATVIKYMTDGVLLRETLRDADVEHYSCIVMDEAHERSLNTDVLFGILRGVLARRRDLRLIVTSATMNADRFAAFFGHCPIFRIPGRTFAVTRHWARAVPDDYVDAAVKQVLQIHLGQPPGDVLVFMTGQEDIEATCEVLAERVEAVGTPAHPVPPLLVLPMYSQLPADLQAKIFERAASGARKVIVATNVAETSLTVDGIVYVVDCGFGKLKQYNSKVGMDLLLVTPISQANADQRAGRAGRTGPGHCYRLFTEATYRRDMLAAQVPEIQRTNLSSVVLLLKSLGVDDILGFPFMDAPPADNINSSLYQLWALGALDGAGRLTPAGKRMVDFPLDPALAKMLVLGESLGCSAEVATIVSMLNVGGSVFFRPKDREAESDAAREKFMVPESDHLTLLNCFQQWQRHGRRPEWCAEHFLHAKMLRKAEEIRQQLCDILAKHRIAVTSCGQDWDVVRRAVCAGYFVHSARMKGLGDYVNLLTGLPCVLHPSSALFGLGYTPDYVVYHELVFTGTKEYMSCVTAVEALWLAELGPAFFSVRGRKGAGAVAAPANAVAAGTGAPIFETAPTPTRWELAAQQALARPAGASAVADQARVAPSASTYASASATPMIGRYDDDEEFDGGASFSLRSRSESVARGAGAGSTAGVVGVASLAARLAASKAAAADRASARGWVTPR